MTDRPYPLLVAFALVHTAVGVVALWAAAHASFAGPWVFATVGGPLLVANAIGSTLRRDAFDRKMSAAIAGTMRIGGGLTVAVALMALAQHLDGAWTVMIVALAIAGWGLAYGRVLQDRADQFAE